MEADYAAAVRWLWLSFRVVQTPCVFLLCSILISSSSAHQSTGSPTPCYENGKPQKCVPEFGNVAFNIPVDATNTCGENGRTDFCTQTEFSKTSCASCYAPGNPEGLPSYPPSHLTDTSLNVTWWQSQTMEDGIQYPNQVNLTLHLRKSYDITYVHILFHSPRPESFAIYKRTSEDLSWTPYQFYSLTCRDTYGLDEIAGASVEDETRALCTSEYSEMIPLTGGPVPFATLQGRPSRNRFDEMPLLQEFVTATDIRISLDRINTFGDELWKAPIVMKSYFYAISDITIGARCKCNGHASDCPLIGDGDFRRVCRCEHNTDGPDCERCLPFFNDLPWQRATSTDAHECQPCFCNGFSNRCFFDENLYKRKGRGGHCLDCEGNRAGPNCERCKDNHYQTDKDAYCESCECNEIGSSDKQCNTEGKCQCKPGVGGDKCDRCLANYYEFGPEGCKPCECIEAGSVNNQPHCNAITGVCNCKENVEGRRCQECKPGFFNLDKENDYGCTPCFCYGHASVCESATGYSKVVTESSFARGSEKWGAEDSDGHLVPISYSAVTQTISVSQEEATPVYFSAPQRFLIDQRASYNQDLEFKLRITGGSPAPGRDLVIEGASLTISQPIFGQNNPLPTSTAQEYKFRLHEHSDHGWQPRLTARDFISVLSNITAIKVRGTYVPRGVGFMDDFRLHTARRGAAGSPAKWIEMCSCLPGYVGQFCESCAHKFHHDPANGGPFARCVPCNCNKHADSCEEDSGRCICQHNTEGENCERCARGFYGNSLEGTANDCKPCPCPGGGSCIELDNDEVVCLECPKGYSGHRCDLCSDGYFGDPTGKYGPIRQCMPCECNGNVDLNAVGNCNRTTGECLKCIYNTGGPQCDQCLLGYFGDALSTPKGDCKPCQCYLSGTQQTELGPPLCDQLSGRCQCKKHVVGTNCEECEQGYFNISSGMGCESCNCDPIGSLNRTCNVDSGQCFCRAGVTGKQCNECEEYHFGFSVDGCQPCLCDDIGSYGAQCNSTGQCPCRDNVEGRTCDRCKENKYDRQRGCIDCPVCYSLIQDAADSYRKQLSTLRSVLNDISNNPTVIDDADFEEKLNGVRARVDALATEAQHGIGVGGEGLSSKLDELNERLKQIDEELISGEKLRQTAAIGVELGASNVSMAEDAMERARLKLANALEYLRTEGNSALSRALNRSDQFGQQNKHISEISQEARHLAAEHEKEAARIKDISLQAENISTEAINILKDAISKNRNTTDLLINLKENVTDLERRVDSTQALATDAQMAANQTLNEALQVYQDIENLQVPEPPAARLKQEAEQLSKQAEQIAQDAMDLNNNNVDAWQELKKLLEESEQLLAKGEEQQMRANELLAEVDMAKTMAVDAVKLGQSTINEAQETLSLLSGFEKGVQDSKDRALLALKTLPEIQDQINKAKLKTLATQNDLSGAKSNAEKARDTAQEAQANYAERASKEAHNIRTEAEETKSKAGKLRDETDALADKVAATSSRLDDLEKQAVQDETLTHEAKQKVGQAKLSVTDAAKQVQRAMENVTGILKELDALPEIDEAALAELEKRLDEAELSVKESDMDRRMQTLKGENFDLTNLVNHYGKELKKLKEEVWNIQKISESLPDGCFKIKPVLEP